MDTGRAGKFSDLTAGGRTGPFRTSAERARAANIDLGAAGPVAGRRIASSDLAHINSPPTRVLCLYPITRREPRSLYLARPAAKRPYRRCCCSPPYFWGVQIASLRRLTPRQVTPGLSSGSYLRRTIRSFLPG